MGEFKSAAFVLVCLLCLTFSTLVEATVYSLGNSGWSLIVSSSLAHEKRVSIPYVYSEDKNSVVIELDKTFFGTIDAYGNLEPLAVEFQKTSANAVSTIVIRDEYIVNDKDRDSTGDYDSIVILTDPTLAVGSRLRPEGSADQTRVDHSADSPVGTGPRAIKEKMIKCCVLIHLCFIAEAGKFMRGDTNLIECIEFL